MAITPKQALDYVNNSLKIEIDRIEKKIDNILQNNYYGTPYEINLKDLRDIDPRDGKGLDIDIKLLKTKIIPELEKRYKEWDITLFQKNNTLAFSEKTKPYYAPNEKD